MRLFFLSTIMILFTLAIPFSAWGGCCKYCDVGQACGNSCISSSFNCHQPEGCACDGKKPINKKPTNGSSGSKKPKYKRTSRSIPMPVNVMDTQDGLCAYVVNKKGEANWVPGRIIKNGNYLLLTVEIRNVKYLIRFYTGSKSESFERLLKKLKRRKRKATVVCESIA